MVLLIHMRANKYSMNAVSGDWTRTVDGGGSSGSLQQHLVFTSDANVDLKVTEGITEQVDRLEQALCWLTFVMAE